MVDSIGRGGNSGIDCTSECTADTCNISSYYTIKNFSHII